MVSVTVYTIVTFGFTVGFAIVELYPDGFELQLYVLPATADAPIWVVPPKQIARSLPATAAGNGFTVTVTLLLFTQPVLVLVSVRVYVVVTAGLTLGFETVEVNPTGLDTQL